MLLLLLVTDTDVTVTAAVTCIAVTVVTVAVTATVNDAAAVAAHTVAVEVIVILLFPHHVGAGVLLWRHATRLGGCVGLLLLLGTAAWLTVPMDPDEAVVEDGLDAGDGPSGLLVLGVLDQRRLGVSTKHHLEEDGGDSVTSGCSVNWCVERAATNVTSTTHLDNNHYHRTAQLDDYCDYYYYYRYHQLYNGLPFT